MSVYVLQNMIARMRYSITLYHINWNRNDWIKCYDFADLHWAPYFAICLIMYLVKLFAIWNRWTKNTRCKIDYYRFINGASYNMAKSITSYRCNRYMDTLEQIKIFVTDAFNNWEIKQNFDYLKMARLHNIST